MISIKKIAACLVLLLVTLLSAQMWQPAESMPIAVAAGQAVVHGDKIYVISGYSDSLAGSVKAIQIFDPRLNLWQVVEKSITARQGFYLLPDLNRVLWAGGLADAAESNQDLLQWNFIDQPTVYQSNPVFDRIHAAAFLIDNQLLLIGGYSGTAGANLPYILGYDLITQQIIYQENATFPGELPYQQQAAEQKGFVYIFGGIYNGVLNRVFRFDPVGKTLQRIQPNLMQPRAGGQAVATGDKAIYLIGGYNEAQPALASVEIFSIRSGSAFTMSGPNLLTPRREPMAVMHDGSIYVFGGKNNRGESLRTVEKLDVGSSTRVINRNQQPQTIRLGNNYPNPFNLQTCISIMLQKTQYVRLEITSLDGRQVQVLHDGVLIASEHRFIWNGTNEQQQAVAAGVYFCRLFGENYSEYIKMLFLP